MSGAATAQAVSSGAAEKPRVSQPLEVGGLDDARWRPMLELPCQLVVELPLPHFQLADFLKLAAGSVIATEWRVTRDVPLRVNGTLIAWGEFDGSGKRLAVRLTELA
jgi:flagellar motor switch/type III secretory pathway protein FliN